MATPVRLRRAAAADIDSTVDYLAVHASPAVAARFIDSTEAAIGHLSRHPHHGTLRFSYELDIPGLRAWPLRGFPYLVFYVERDDELDVWRVLHTRRDIPATLADLEADG